MSSKRGHSFVQRLFIGSAVVCVAWFSLAKPNDSKIKLRAHKHYKLVADTSGDDSDAVDQRKYKKSKRPTYRLKDRYGDKYSNSQGKANIIVHEPASVKTEVEVDTSGKYYRITEQINGVDYKPPTTMTYEQYRDYQRKNAVKNYYRQKNQAKDEKEAAKKDSKKALIPRIYMNPNMDRIFGGNYIDVKLNGSVLLDFGYRLQITNNPAIPVNQRRIGGFFFDQQINVNAQAKIGERLKITINQDTKSQFDFDNNVKVEYNSLETDIIQKIEAGNVSMPLNTTLIKGAQNLFGIKAILRTGRLTTTLIAANQRGKGQNVKIEGGAQTKNFEIRADNYEDNRHYFLSHFFRNKYESALRTLPQITSGVIVTRVEVWVTNRNNSTTELRNVAAFMDLGENKPFNSLDIRTEPGANEIAASNYSNDLYRNLINAPGGTLAGVRFADNTINELTAPPFNLENGNDFEIMRNARKLGANEFKFHPNLGYISLNAPLGRDDVLGVAYEYSYNGKVYRVGELADDYSGFNDRQLHYVKMLRPSTIRTNVPMWDLQMKNIYSLGVSNVSRENFQLRVIYRDDRTQLNNPSLQEGRLSGEPLIQVMNLDQLNMSNDPQPDGNFDFVDNGTVNNAVAQNTNPAFQMQNQQAQTIQNDPNNPNQSLNNQNNPNLNSFASQNRLNAVTIDPTTGRVIFPVLEPFGTHLKSQMGQDSTDRPELISKYVYNELYRSTKADALQLANKNKFFLVGRVQSSSSDEIQLQGFNIPPGSVRVTGSSGQVLTEGADYTVDYNLGRVKIINPAYLMPGQSVNVGYEQSDLFQVRQRTFYGSRFDYVVNKDIALGGTFLALNERPIISRVSIGDEPINNKIWGLDGTYKKDSRFITRLIDALPVIQTKEKSTLQVNAEFAQLLPGAPRLVQKNGEPTFFLDDFENTQIPFRLDNAPALNWRLGATPKGFEGVNQQGFDQVLSQGYRRALLSWYVIDPVFYRGSGTGVPSNITNVDLANNYVRPVAPWGIFHNKDRQQINVPEPVMDLAFFPNERGPYNYNVDLNPDGTLKNPEQNFGAITRAVNNYDTDFDNMNYQYLEFWLMDPFIQGEGGRVLDGKLNKNNTTGGKLEVHLGSISEDVIKDGKHGFEQGLPVPAPSPVDATGLLFENTPWGRVTNQQYLVNAFDTRGGSRAAQDVGLDGLSNDLERQKHSLFINRLSALTPEARQVLENDPSGDDFKFYLGSDYDARDAKILERYKKYNGTENNSPDNAGQFNASSYLVPDNEDLNQNNTLNDVEEYFKYQIDLRPNSLSVGNNYVINEVEELDFNRQTINGVKWYQVRIPLREGFEKVGNIENFKSIRFMRLLLTGWQEPVVLRMSHLQLVAMQWRPFVGDLTSKGIRTIIEPDDKVLTVSTVSVEENGQASATNPIPYNVPPGFNRDRDLNTTVARRLNETSLRLCVDNLQDNDARAVFKNIGGLNLINYNNVRMFVNGQTFDGLTKDDDLNVFIRFGSDFTDNYYEIEKPLKLTSTDLNNSSIWKDENSFAIVLEELADFKLERDRQELEGNTNKFNIFTREIINNETSDAARKHYWLSIRGNPQYTNIQTIMIGIRNPRSTDASPKSACIWVNELRVSGIKYEPSIAATGRVNIKLADLGNVSATAKHTGAGFGGLEQKPSQRLLETTNEFGTNTNMAMDKFIPKNDKIGIKLPMFASYERKVITPKYDPLNPDVLLRKSGDVKPDSVKDNYLRLVEDRTDRRTISFTNIQKVKVKPNAKKHIYDIENFALTLGYSETKRSNVNIESYNQRNYRGGLGWAYSPKPFVIEPFKPIKGIKSPWLKSIKDINLTPFPNNLMVRGDLDRTITRTQYSGGIIGGKHYIQGIPVNYEKRFLFNRNYAVGWSVTKSITLNYNAQVNAIIDEPEGAPNEDPAYWRWRRGASSGRDSLVFSSNQFTKKDSILYNLQNGGRIKTFNQQVGANYKVPLDKFPILSWTSADARYAAGYTWNAGAVGIPDSLFAGNTAQNTRDITLNGKLDFAKLYGKNKWLAKALNPPKQEPKRAAPPPIKPGLPIPKDTVKKPPELQGLKAIARFVLMLKSFNMTYQRSEGTVLPGYMGKVKYFGFDDSRTSNNTLYTDFHPFILGYQGDDVYKNPNFSSLYMTTIRGVTQTINQNRTENVTGRANLEPFRDFRIQLDAKVSTSQSYQELYKYNHDSSKFESLNPYKTGTYSISFLAIQTFFVPDREDNSNQLWDNTLLHRKEVIQRYTASNPYTGDSLQYDTSSQDVLVPAFIAAYTGQEPGKVGLTAYPRIPLPNWRIDYAGLPNVFPGLKTLFPSININHAYSSTYSVASYQSNIKYYNSSYIRPFAQTFDYSYPDNDIDYPNRHVDSSSLVAPVNVITNVSILERFAPLLGINLRTKNNITIRAEYKTDRNLNFSVPNITLTEAKTNDITVGFGYTKPNMKLPFRYAGRDIVLKNDVTFRIDFSRRGSTTLQRLRDGTSKVTNGTINFQIRPTIAYQVNQRLTTSLYFEYNRNTIKINSLVRTLIAFGIQIRYSLS